MVGSIHKNIINECGRIVINSSRFINYREEGIRLYRQQKIMGEIGNFRFEEINIEIVHKINNFVEGGKFF